MLFIWLFSRAQTRQLNPAFRKRRQHRSEWGCISLTTVQRPSRENRRYYRKLSVINIQVGFSKLQQGYWSSLFPSLSRSRRRETAKGSGTRQFWGPCSPRALLTPPFPWTTCPPPPHQILSPLEAEASPFNSHPKGGEANRAGWGPRNVYASSPVRWSGVIPAHIRPTPQNHPLRRNDETQPFDTQLPKFSFACRAHVKPTCACESNSS